MRNDQLNNTPSGKKEKIYSTVGIIIVIVLLVAIVFFGYRVYKQMVGLEGERQTLNEGVSAEEKRLAVEKMRDLYNSEAAPVSLGAETGDYGLEDADEGLKPSGKIVFSGQIIGSPRVTHLFALDVASTAEPVRYLPEHETSAMAEFDDQADPSKIYFLGSRDSRIDDVAIHALELDSDTVEVLSEGKGFGVRSIAWSDTAKLLAFNRLNKPLSSNVDLTDLENWEIVVLNAAGENIGDINGARQPHWSPDGTKLLFFKTDGLYVYDFADGSERRIQSVSDGGKIVGTTMMNLSQDGKYLVWTTAKLGVITIYEISSWDTIELKELGRIQSADTEYYWPQFSPDGKFYVVQAIDGFKFNEEEGIETRENARFEVRQTTGRDIVYTYSLDKFAFNLLFTDDWIAK